MENYETEEQQVEAIKKWWADNYKMVIVLGVIGIGGIVGVQQWKQNQIVKAQNASMEYDIVLQGVTTKQTDKMSSSVDNLQQDYADYPYAALAAMLEAKTMIAAKQLDSAEKKYQWVIEHSNATSLKHIARIRLASLLSSQGKNEQALKLLDTEQGTFKARYLEIKGDVLVALKRIEEARSAYDQALESYASIGANTQILKIKRNDLGNS